MIRAIHRNKQIIIKKLQNLSNNNKSSLESNRTAISNGIKNSFDNNFVLNSNIYFKKIIKKNLKTKYDINPFKFTLIRIQNFIDSKYCRTIAIFKESLIFYYEEEFLKRYYQKYESIVRIPKFFNYYTNYLLFFCKPTLKELHLSEQLIKYYEKKAHVFYNDNYTLKNKNNEKKNNNNNKNNNNKEEIIFTEKIRKIISGQSSSSQLIIKKNENSSILTFYSLENSILNLLNGNKKENLVKTERPKFKFKINENNRKENFIQKHFITNSIQKEELNNSNKIYKNYITFYNKHSRNIINHNNPLFRDENVLTNNFQVNKHLKILSSQNGNFPLCLTERNDNNNQIKRNTKIPLLTQNNNIKKRTTSFSIKGNSQKNYKKNKPKLLSYISITPSKKDQINFGNTYKTINNHGNEGKRNFHFQKKIIENNQKNISKKGINYLKDYVQIQKQIIKYKLP